MTAVPDFARTLLKKAGAPAGHVRAYIEPPFKTESGAEVRPDGAVFVERGGRKWVALFEVKTQANELRREQVEAYIDLARSHDYQAVITISNQISRAHGEHPLQVDRKKLRRVSLHHWSWSEVLTEAIIQHEHRQISDPEQAWILGELIAYLKHPSSGAMQFQDMGQNWVRVREAARDGTLRSHDPGVAEVVAKWEQFIQYLCLQLSAELGVEVQQVVGKKDQDAAARLQSRVRELVESKCLSGQIRVRHAVGPITLEASLAARTTTASVAVEAPEEGKPLTRINWLLRQLRESPEHVTIHAQFPNAKEGTSARLGSLREDPSLLLLAGDRRRPPRSFTVALSTEMGTKRSGSGSFVSEATHLLLTFYGEVVQSIKPWRTPAPKLSPDRAGDNAEQPDNIVDQAFTEATAPSTMGLTNGISPEDQVAVGEP
ncbi:MAG TPA: hypothetical protein VNM91_09420 [Dehalococcoidia bacterium]|nr:hypothetical protein [Dehalococcoidia bacterium]